jgi:hypothetical protein
LNAVAAAVYDECHQKNEALPHTLTIFAEGDRAADGMATIFNTSEQRGIQVLVPKGSHSGAELFDLPLKHFGQYAEQFKLDELNDNIRLELDLATPRLPHLVLGQVPAPAAEDFRPDLVADETVHQPVQALPQDPPPDPSVNAPSKNA